MRSIVAVVCRRRLSEVWRFGTCWHRVDEQFGADFRGSVGRRRESPCTRKSWADPTPKTNEISRTKDFIKELLLMAVVKDVEGCSAAPGGARGTRMGSNYSS